MRKLACIAFVLITLQFRAQHNVMFSQYMFNGLLINPAYAGSHDVLSATVVDRMQWVGFDGAPQTLAMSVHSPLKNKKLNVGLTFIKDHLGITDQNKISAFYAYRIFFSKSSLSLGLDAGFDMIRNNWNKIQTTTPGDVVFNAPYSQQNIPTSGFGVYYKAEKFYAGASAPDLVYIGAHDNKLFRPTLVTAGYLFTLSDNIRLKPSFLVKYIKHSPVELDANLNAYFRNLGIGFSYRTNDEMVFLLQYNINIQFSCGYSYDLTLSRLSTYVRGSHEIMLRYEFGYKVNPQSPRYF